MAEIVYNCPRCGTKQITLDVLQARSTGSFHGVPGNMMGQIFTYDLFCCCRGCYRSCILAVRETKDTYQVVQANGLMKLPGALNKYVAIDGPLTVKDNYSISAPDYLPDDIVGVFKEGATCFTVGCFNAAGTMFRLCIDMITRSKLPPENDASVNSKTRRDLGLRLPWLFENGKLPGDLRELATSVKEDGNDGAHQGTLDKADAEDLLDFTVALLERLYTEPERVRLAQERRAARRTVAKPSV